MTEQFTALTDAQVDQLAEWLDTLAIPNMGMNLEALDGFLTALVLRPEPIPFEEWETEVWGENAAAVEKVANDLAQARQHALLKQHGYSVAVSAE